MIELFPAGLRRGRQGARHRARRVHGRRRRGAPLGVLRQRAKRRRRVWLGGPLARVPSPDPRRSPLGRPAVGDATRRCTRRHRRPGPRVRHRVAPDDPALPANAAGARAPARCSTSGAARACCRSQQRCSATPGARGRHRGALDRSNARERARERRHRRREARRRRRAASELPLVVANISLDSVEALPARTDAQTLITSGYFASEQPKLPGFEHVKRTTLDGWASDVYRRT